MPNVGFAACSAALHRMQVTQPDILTLACTTAERTSGQRHPAAVGTAVPASGGAIALRQADAQVQGGLQPQTALQGVPYYFLLVPVGHGGHGRD